MSMNLGEEDITGFLHELPKEVVMSLPGSPTKHNSSRGLRHGKSYTGLPTLTLTPESSTPKRYNVTKAPIILVPDSEEENDNAILPWMSFPMHLTKEIQTSETIKKHSLDMVDPSSAAGLDKGRPTQHTQFQPTQGDQLKYWQPSSQHCRHIGSTKGKTYEESLPCRQAGLLQAGAVLATMKASHADLY
ncbi:hypothetical protein V8E55_007188 [Tylopilus felleus]